jgi:AcrR family transcriptional regulator
MLVVMSRDSKPNNTIRPALVEAAARLIANEGPAGLTLRRVADEVGVSTMAIYTHFGGMPELRRAVRMEWFARLAERLTGMQESEDPVADLALLGVAYAENASRNPHLYRATFMEVSLDESDAHAHLETFDVLSRAIERCIKAGRFAPADPDQLAFQFWAIGHGAVTRQLAGLLAPEEALSSGAGGVLSLLIGWGDNPDAARRSLIEAGRRAGLASPPTRTDALSA